MYTLPNSTRLEPIVHANIIALDSVGINLTITYSKS